MCVYEWTLRLLFTCSLALRLWHRVFLPKSNRLKHLPSLGLSLTTHGCKPLPLPLSLDTARLFPHPSAAMAVTTVNATQISAGGYTYPYGRGSVPPLPSSQSLTLLNSPRHAERPSIKLKITSSGSNIVNATVIDAAGLSLYSISSNSKRTTLLSCRNNAEVATVEWDRSSPCMVFRGQKIKCKEWLPLAGRETE
jgi:hypothetical protein